MKPGDRVDLVRRAPRRPATQEEVDARHAAQLERPEGVERDRAHALGDGRRDVGRDDRCRSRRRRTSRRSRTTRACGQDLADRRGDRRARCRARRTRSRARRRTPRRAPSRRARKASSSASASSSGPCTLLMPTLEPRLRRLDEHGPAERLADARGDARDRADRRRRGAARASARRRCPHRAAPPCRTPCPCSRPSRARRRRRTGSPSVSSSPWIVPSSPNGPCSTGKTTSIWPAPARRSAPTSAPPPAPGTSDVPPSRRELRRRRALGGRQQRRGAVDHLPAAGVVDQQRDDVVALGIERLDHRARRGERDRVLGRAAAGHDGDAHARGSRGRGGRAGRDGRSSWPTRERDDERLDVRALDVLVEHDAVLGRVGDRLVDVTCDVRRLSRPRLDALRASSSVRPRTVGTSIVHGLLARSKLDRRALAHERAGRRATASRPARRRPSPSSARPGGSLTIRPAVLSAARASASVLPTRLGTCTEAGPGRDPERDRRADGRGLRRRRGSVRVTLPLSIESLASDCWVGLKSVPSCCSASASVSPTMFGIGFCPRETLSDDGVALVQQRRRRRVGRDDDVGVVLGVAHELALDLELQLVALERSRRPRRASCPRDPRACARRRRASTWSCRRAGRRRASSACRRRADAEREGRERADGEHEQQHEQPRPARALARSGRLQRRLLAAQQRRRLHARRDARRLDRRHVLGRLGRDGAPSAPCAATGTRPRRTRSRSAANSSALP